MWKKNMFKELEAITENIQTVRNTRSPEEVREKKVVLYGAGIDGLKVLGELQAYQTEVVAFFDIRADQIGEMKGIPVKKPGEGFIPENERGEIPIILTVKPFKPRNEAIIKSLRENGYNNIIKATDMFDFYSFTQSDAANLNSIKEAIITCAQLLEDEISYEIYKGFIASHATRQYDQFSDPGDKTKYFDSDFNENKGYQRYIDCGAFDGDTLADLNRIKGKIEKTALFESDMQTFKALVDRIGDNANKYADELLLYPCGVWSNTVKLWANNSMGLNSHISKDGDDMIQCVSLDQVLGNFNPTFIKMDVEGAEYQALTGARKMIERNKPDMVISLYHELKDIWELPLLINSWDLGYKFYIRVYGAGGNATMLYAFAG